jgi:hypothetical protein
MSELVNYYELNGEPTISGFYTTSSGKYQVHELKNKGEEAKYNYEEIYTSPMLNQLVWIKSLDIDPEEVQYLYGDIRVRIKIFYDYSEYYYIYTHSDGSKSYYLQVIFNDKEIQKEYELPSSIDATQLESKEEYIDSIISAAMDHPIPPSPSDKDLVTQDKIILDSQVDGSTRSFDLGVEIKTLGNTSLLFNGQELDYGKEYTIDGNTLTLNNNTPTPESGDRLTLRYIYAFNKPK